jgi:serine/threonine protein kinase
MDNGTATPPTQNIEEDISQDFVDILQNSLWISSPEYAGWLFKRSENWFRKHSLLLRNHVWQKKWVSLHGTELVYMDKEPIAENMKNIKIRRSQISGTTIVAGDENNGEAAGFTVHFQVEHTPDWHFRAESVEEKANWLIKLSQVHAIAYWLEEYERVKVLGIGGQGTVYELVHNVSGKRLAMKEMEIKNEKQMQLAITEALLLKSIVENVSHPNIMRIEKVFQVGSKFYLAFPLCTGGELYEAVASRGHFSEHDAAIIIHDLISALDALHAHDILHLDIKPENILFETKDPRSKILLTDFGLSKLFSEEEKTNSVNREQFHKNYQHHIEAYIQRGDIEASSIRGTNGYLSPEIIVDGYYSKAADVFASGVVLYILLCGYPPFYTRSTRQTYLKTVKGLYRIEGDEWDAVTEEAKDLVRKMLTVDPEQRITTAEILKHPWILAAEASEPVSVDASLKATTGSLQAIKEEEEEAHEALVHAEVSKLTQELTNVSMGSTEKSLSASTPKKRLSITEDATIRHVNMSTALSRLQDHIQVLKTEKMASAMTKFLSSAGQQGNSRLADSYLIPINEDLVTKEERAVASQQLPSDKLLYMIGDDMREELSASIFNHFAADKNRLTIEEFLNCRRKLGLSPTSVSTEKLNASINVGEILLMRLIDRDGDGYISVEDLETTQVLMTQKNEIYLHAIFRIYTESLWYPGKNINYLNHLQHINFRGANSSVAATVQHHLPSILGGSSNKPPHPSAMDGLDSPAGVSNKKRLSKSAEEKSLDVIEPPKYITAKNVAAVFEKFGYQPKYADTVFSVLCETLQRIRLGTSKKPGVEIPAETSAHNNDNTNDNNNNTDMPPDSHQHHDKDSDDDDEEEIKKAPDSIWHKLSFRAGQPPAAAGDSENESAAPSAKNVRKHKMDFNDFVRAARIDDVLIQILFRPQHHRLYALLERAKHRLVEEQNSQLSLPVDQRKEITLKNILHEEVKKLFREDI